ncbi:5-demethoxyubiquinol-8 5-hydroxylase UbiM [Psychrobacter lutiphocae]|uniref:5-demethoxyubiquinol-8 5-hydroxylase UbiM n=1 Tax=Psychrobacter lutiphocae TaxID=540500 RepID=UPI00036C142D|nr:5-demethoxyubiquinol-8 5-hydroxylase UbiM [Psychrobacter lutiphocae]
MTQHSDIIVVGAGPAGLSFCRNLADTGLTITLIDPHTAEQLANAPFDGREIALTHPSKKIMQQLGIWQLVAEEDIHPLRQAKVINGSFDYALHFKTPKQDSKKQALDTLGYFISNYHIRRAAYQSVANQDNITWRLNEKVKTAFSDEKQATVILESGEQLTADLLIAADSRFSTIRRQMGITSDTYDFGRTVMVFRVEHELPSDHTAMECFFYGSTLALLPLSDHVTNCVVTIDSRKAQSLRELTDDELAAHIAKQLDYRFGAMKMASEVNEYPLAGVHARHFYSKRCALIGDAACGMHPVTAQGFNLGLQSQDILAKLIKRSKRLGWDISSDRLLREYNLRHQKNTRVIYHGTNAVVKLFTDDRLPARILRDGVLHVSNNLPPLKRMITRRLTG